jgi:DNA-binding HxlR family transcriptional regulator
MPTSRSYGDACGIARALDVVGERWALLVVRELLFGPQRFSDLRRGLPGASSNLVADRLRELTARGVVQRRKLAPPAGSWVYELTAWGRELDPVIVALGNWGLRVPLPDGPAALGPVSVLLYLRTAGRPAPGDRSAVQIDFDGRVWTARARGGRVQIEAGESPGAGAVLHTGPATFNALLEDPRGLDAALADGSATMTGDMAAVRRLIGAVAAAA